MKTYFAPRSDLTSYVFLEQLMAMKISDASWVNDEEPPPQFLEYSDDEEEQRVKREMKMKKKEARGESASAACEATQPKRPRASSNRGPGPSQAPGQAQDPRRCNQRYTPESNPFYRTSRGYQPGAGGGGQWSQYQAPQQYSYPPPPHQLYYPPPSPAGAQTPSWAAVPPPPAGGQGPAPAWTGGGQWPGVSPLSPYQQLAANISQHQAQAAPSTAPNTARITQLRLDSPPPPPPPGE